MKALKQALIIITIGFFVMLFINLHLQKKLDSAWRKIHILQQKPDYIPAEQDTRRVAV